MYAIKRTLAQIDHFTDKTFYTNDVQLISDNTAIIQSCLRANFSKYLFVLFDGRTTFLERGCCVSLQNDSSVSKTFLITGGFQHNTENSEM